MNKEKRFYYISNSSLKSISGGWSGLNYNIHKILKRHFELNYIGPINPQVSKYHLWKSKLMRLFGFKSDYYFYSENRLKEINRELKDKITENYSCFFYGATPYISYKPNGKYYVLTDVSFADYYKYYNKDQFKDKDLSRIKRKEKLFFKNAEKVFFTSNWALKRTMDHYKLKGQNFINTGIAGNIRGTLSYRQDVNTKLLYISQNFESKGGSLLYRAFVDLLEKHNGLSLSIIGGEPPEEIKNHKGVNYYGFLDKSKPEENSQYIKLLSESDLLVLPTKADAAPLTIIECGYFGTPSIAPARFAIPEMIEHKASGYLLKFDFSVDDLKDAIICYLNLDLLKRNAMREYTSKYYQAQHSWARIEKKLINEL